jgi:hypothetical protein
MASAREYQLICSKRLEKRRGFSLEPEKLQRLHTGFGLRTEAAGAARLLLPPLKGILRGY